MTVLGRPIEDHDRPWGGYSILAEKNGMTIAAVKILTVDPGEALSLQKHRMRTERWVALDDGLEATIGGDTVPMVPGQAYDVPTGVVHRLANPSRFPCKVVEVMFGHYEEGDIERLEDRYGRR